MKLINTDNEAGAFDTSIDTPKRVGLLLFFLVFGVFGIWSAVAPLDGAAQAPGTVMVRSYSQVVQHLEGGIIRQILVENGDLVRAGQALIELDDTQPLAQLEIARSQYVALRVREARLVAERDRQSSVDYPDLSLFDATHVDEEINSQDEIFVARKAAIDGSIEVLEQRIDQLESQVVGLEALRTTKTQLAASYSEELDDVNALLEQGFSDKNKLRELERSLATNEGDAAELTANISSTQVQIGETRLQILQQEKEFLNEVVNELGELQTSLKDVEERIIALQDVVSRTVIRAPVDGTVNGTQFHTIGGVISPGTRIVDIVPEGEELVIEAKVSPLDIDRVAVNQLATIRFSSFNSQVPNIFGEVTNLSADSLVDELTGLPYYQARIEVTPEGMASLGELILLPGMPAEVFIATGSRTFLQYLFKPLSNAVARSFRED